MSEDKFYQEIRKLQRRFSDLVAMHEGYVRKFDVLRAETDDLQEVAAMQMNLISDIAALADAGDAHGIRTKIQSSVQALVQTLN